MQNVLAYAGEIFGNIRIGIPQNGQPKTSEKCVPFPVVFPTICGEMLAPVQFNHQTGRCNVKIDNVVSNHPLPMDRDGKGVQKVVPEMAFLFGHAAPQVTGSWREFGVVAFHGGASLPSSVTFGDSFSQREKPLVRRMFKR
jgi:hypothetical protein